MLGQTLYFQFCGFAESRQIFLTLGIEPWGRFLTISLESVAVILLLIPRTAVWGGFLSFGVMTGTIIAHLTRLGFEVNGDGGLLFLMALSVWTLSGWVVWLRRTELPRVGRSPGLRCSIPTRAI